MPKRYFTRAQVLAWSDKWSHSDKEAIRQTLDRLPSTGVEFYDDRDGGGIAATIDGKKVFVIRPGYVGWPSGRWLQGMDASLFPRGVELGDEGNGTYWAELSTYQGRDQSAQSKQRDYGLCPDCWKTLPATGVCDCRA